MWDGSKWRTWRLVAKLDPDKTLPREALAIIKGESVDAVIVGGTQGINYNNTTGLVRSIREAGYSGPLVQEVSVEDVVVPNVDAHFIPVVLNAEDKKWLVDVQLSAIKRYRPLIRWDNVLTEGYLIGNKHSAAGRLTHARDMSIEDVVAYTVLAERIFNIPLLYLEYSGVFGDMELVRAVSRTRKKIHLFYGGGITEPEHIESVAPLVDTLVIGNIFYDNPVQAGKIIDFFKIYY